MKLIIFPFAFVRLWWKRSRELPNIPVPWRESPLLSIPLPVVGEGKGEGKQCVMLNSFQHLRTMSPYVIQG